MGNMMMMMMTNTLGCEAIAHVASSEGDGVLL
jgi:hypothetical protein